MLSQYSSYALSLFCAPATLQRSPRQHLLPDGSIWQQFLPYGSPLRCRQHLRHGAASLQTLRHSAPASNKPHSAEKSTPVWLAIWRIWTGLANSQLRRETFSSTYLHICAHPHCSYVGLLLRHSKSFDPSAPIAYATSVSPPNKAVACPDAAFLQITARTNPRSRHLWGTLARAVASN